MDFNQLTKIAIKAALKAGDVIEKNKEKKVSIKLKKENVSYRTQVVTEIDYECEKEILKVLLPTCKEFDIAILTEETEDNKSRLIKDFFWCVDPLDGTLAYINNTYGYSISIALVSKTGIPFIGVVYDPVTKTLYHATKGNGAFKNKKQWKITSSNNYLTYLTDKTLALTPNHIKIKSLLKKIRSDLKLKFVKEISGSGAVLNAIKVAENSPACMIKLPKENKGGGSIWDYAATSCIFKELGLLATDFYGKDLNLNKVENSFMNENGIYYRTYS